MTTHTYSHQAALASPHQDNVITCTSLEGADIQDGTTVDDVTLVCLLSEVPKHWRTRIDEARTLSLSRREMSFLINGVPSMEFPNDVFPPLQVRNTELAAFMHGGPTIVVFFCREHEPKNREYNTLARRFPYLEAGIRAWVATDDTQVALGSIHYTKVSADVEIAAAVIYEFVEGDRDVLNRTALEACLQQIGTRARERKATIQLARLLGNQSPGVRIPPRTRFNILDEVARKEISERGIPATIYLPRFPDAPASE